MTKEKMGSRTNRKKLIRALRNLERKGFIELRLDQNGELRWHATEQGQRVEPSEADISEELLN